MYKYKYFGLDWIGLVYTMRTENQSNPFKIVGFFICFWFYSVFGFSVRLLRFALD